MRSARIVKKYFFVLLLILLSYSLFSLIEKNDNNDVGLVEKNGTFGFSPYMRSSYFQFLTGVGTNEYSEIGFRIKMLMEFQELQGFYFNGDMQISRNSLSTYSKGDLSWWNSFVPYFGTTHFGYKHKYFTIKLGFQNFRSSDAIYNHLLLDDYSGSLFGLSATAMIGRFVDIELNYIMVRPHQGPWYQGDSTIDVPSHLSEKDRIALYGVTYGKSLYTHKINIRPLPWIRIGIYEGAYFLGENINPWYANPFFIYIGSQLLANVIEDKSGSRYNMHAANLLAGADFNIGFKGWRVYGELFFDDFVGEYFKFEAAPQPVKMGFVIGGELRGYLFTNYIKFSPIVEFILNGFYFNIEYGVVSKYTYARDANFNYEYVREEYQTRFDIEEPAQKEINSVNRIGNYLGFMYGPNSDCFDIAIGWRNDLKNIKEYNAEYQADVYFDSQKKKTVPQRLFKAQIHYRRYRLGDERNVIMPFWWNYHPAYELYYADGSSNKKGVSRGTEFLAKVLEIGNILNLELYSDIFRFNRFVLGAETKFHFKWQTFLPWTPSVYTEFNFRWEFGLIISW